ncbi:Permease of the drug/metabolite transporter (DMT) superfamily [Lutimaribacter pacificus]|uniref:Permease of the drug/metabolite transporter (DMT) superfamily n=1 Tax=Lutimaribacter pacificus TaxID=391948 RepID=A0A1H0JMR8_9RHOB|nr:DMT family transporter [Lutimaribacter pacificus]SDO45097.1 Permease of the drug/metabolite transporter (DMT) superfamily [Lutimaribacter pacificus]SHK08351.1 Permease of the drug/metabolite transporter (DMT) superfamily [Lutimaribacter pacificus]
MTATTVPAAPAPEITGASWAMVATLGLVWGGTFLVTELALEVMTPFWIASARIGFAAALTLVVWVLRGRRLFLEQRRDWPNLILIGLLSTAVPFMLLAWGQQYVTAGFAGVSMAAVALVVLPLAHVMVPGERMTLRRLAGFVIGFVGVLVLIGPDAFRSTGVAGETWGQLACLGAAACYALSSVLMRRLPAIDPVGLSGVTLLIGAVFVLAMAVTVEGAPANPGLYGLGLLAFLGLIPTAAANMLRVSVIRSAGPVFMSLTNYQVPVWSVLLGVLLLGEPLRASLLVAMALILCGVALSQYGALRRLFARG